MPRLKGTKTKTGIVKAPKQVEPLIKSSLLLLGVTYTASGNTIEEAIKNLKPEISIGLGVLTLEKGTVRKEAILPQAVIFRLFGVVDDLTKEITLSNVISLFDKREFE